jgi:HEPN domain-containing protein
MSRQRTPEDAKYWLDEADQRLEHARGYVPERNARILCEQAHYAAEFSIKAVIIANGRSFVTSHDIRELIETARAAGETIPAGVEQAKGLSTYAGSGRYDFDRDPARMGRQGRVRWRRRRSSCDGRMGARAHRADPDRARQDRPPREAMTGTAGQP